MMRNTSYAPDYIVLIPTIKINLIVFWQFESSYQKANDTV